MSSGKTHDFLSELKATLSKLTSRDEPAAVNVDNVISDVIHNVTEPVAQTPTPQLTIRKIAVDHRHLEQPQQQPQNHHNNHLESEKETTGGVFRRNVLYGELSSVLEKRGQEQQLNDERSASRVVELESRLKPGNINVFLFCFLYSYLIDY